MKEDNNGGVYIMDCQSCQTIYLTDKGCETRCPGCAELERLEREIGRAMVSIRILAGVPIDDNIELLIMSCVSKLREEIGYKCVRWRQLHAEGAEGRS